MKIHILDRLVEHIRWFGDISVLDDSAYGQFNGHSEKAN